MYKKSYQTKARGFEKSNLNNTRKFANVSECFSRQDPMSNIFIGIIILMTQIYHVFSIAHKYKKKTNCYPTSIMLNFISHLFHPNLSFMFKELFMYQMYLTSTHIVLMESTYCVLQQVHHIPDIHIVTYHTVFTTNTGITFYCELHTLLVYYYCIWHYLKHAFWVPYQ